MFYRIYFCFFFLFLFFAAFTQQGINPYHYDIQKMIQCNKGGVVSAHSLASQVGINILKEGGNAIDAAIATQLALAVVYPGAGNIGGGGFMVAHLKNGENITLDYREMAPSSASRDMYLDEKGNPVMSRSQDGHLSAGVPGTVAGLFASLKYSNLSFNKLIQPAIELADKGFSITKSQAESFNTNKKEFIKLNTIQPIFVKEVPWKSGDTLIQKDLALTLKRIRDYGIKGFYEGETADLIIKEMQRGKGILTYDDLKNYKVKIRKPDIFNYKGYSIVTMPLPSSGGIILDQMMKMIEKRNIGQYKFESAEAIQLMVEVERRAFADRAKFLGDPDFVKVPMKKLVSAEYIKERMKDYKPGIAGNSKNTIEGIIHESEETTHLNVIDNQGNSVSVTTTLNNSYGSKTVVGNGGFLLNDEMDDFSVKPGIPNMYGAIGAEANSIAPGKRMLSSMTPTIVLKNNETYMVIGTPGGTTIPTSVFQTLVDILEFHLSPVDAINSPKFHHQWLPDVIDVENDFPTSTINQLKKMGYKIHLRGNIGRTELILVASKKNFEVIADKRGDDSAAGY